MTRLWIRPRTFPPSSNCRCLFGDPCWPGPAEFARLEHHVSQPLLHPVPPASPCYPVSAPSGDCADVHAQWTNASWRAERPGAMQGAVFETFVFPNGTTSACFMDTALGVPCTQGSVPVVGVDARAIEDVQAAVRFAAAHNLRVVVKTTGHDLLGRSTARGAFIIWTHNMKDITFHRSFTPAGAPPESETHDNAITLGAGVQWEEAYEAVNAKDRAIVGGQSPGGTVGAAAGWVLGGGHSPLSPTFGLGVDNVLEFEMVSSNGTVFTANAHRNTDLFFALRGGGGGTYGIVTKTTYQTHPNLPLTAAVFAASSNSSSLTAPVQSLLLNLLKALPQLSDDGWSGVTSLSTDPTTGTLGSSGTFVLVNGTSAQANASINPFFSKAEALSNASDGGLTVQAAFTTPLPSYFAFLNAFATPDTAGSNGAAGSWLLPRDVIERHPERVARTLAPLQSLTILLVAGGAVARVPPAAMGLLPAWRSALVHALFATGWAEGTPADVIAGRVDEVRRNMTALRALAPHSGAYLNEASPFSPAFFGDHHTELRAIKAVYDPIDLFVVRDGIGSNEWDSELVCKLPNLKMSASAR
ncbi:FAD-binding domain-containing protein [Epithele typhae]|uniref:FAD-binding domain-containing protein n=1 Tax=Epithele typhae TaxID=378194 RepID=UPI002008BE46|nr:FAD-binding domain-containing protein [Epithele typhae]KAH9944362.1 FAD-binding domain-containing protein [Epithele typhae]